MSKYSVTVQYSMYIVLDQLIANNLRVVHGSNSIVKSITLDYPEYWKILRSVLSMKLVF